MSDLIVDTDQEAFDTVVRHFIKQQVRSLDHWGSCVYRAPDGKRCAVGALIKDESCGPEVEGQSACTLSARLNFGVVSVQLLEEMQCIHDGANNGLVSGSVLEELRFVAVKFNLDTTVLDTEYAPLVGKEDDSE